MNNAIGRTSSQTTPPSSWGKTPRNGIAKRAPMSPANSSPYLRKLKMNPATISEGTRANMALPRCSKGLLETNHAKKVISKARDVVEKG